ncbi:hypothetical protein FACS1894103_4130 [Campylobacterota bacterium]|nr:hypothetical protein FACS1894103_4130 [Campylobacterota bacterium]
MSCDCEKTGCLFGLNGISGMLIAVVLLLSIIGVLTVLGLGAQGASAQNPYVVSGSAVANPQTRDDIYANLKGVKMIDETAGSKAFKSK